MEQLKFVLFSIVVLALVGIIGYWAVVTIQSGTEHATSQKIKQLQNENEDLKKEIKNLADELSVLKPKLEESKPESAQAIIYKYQDLINELQKLIDDNISMKLKSSGARVGTVQKFLNIFNNTSNRIDNSYGAGTQKAVTAFQEGQGLKADGEAGPSTFNKMIDWLKKQG